MTPFYEGFTRARQTLRIAERMTEPIDQAVVRPRSVGDRVRWGLSAFRARLVGGPVPADTAREYELAA
jgi:hypothetical protein